MMRARAITGIAFLVVVTLFFAVAPATAQEDASGEEELVEIVGIRTDFTVLGSANLQGQWNATLRAETLLHHGLGSTGTSSTTIQGEIAWELWDNPYYQTQEKQTVSDAVTKIDEGTASIITLNVLQPRSDVVLTSNAFTAALHENHTLAFSEPLQGITDLNMVGWNERWEKPNGAHGEYVDACNCARITSNKQLEWTTDAATAMFYDLTLEMDGEEMYTGHAADDTNPAYHHQYILLAKINDATVITDSAFSAGLIDVTGKFVGDASMQDLEGNYYTENQTTQVNSAIFQTYGRFTVDGTNNDDSTTWTFQGDSVFVANDVNTIEGDREAAIPASWFSENPEAATAVAIGGTGLLASILLVIKNGIWGKIVGFVLQARGGDPLKHRTRQHIMAFLVANPAANIQTIADAVGANRVSVVHHLNVLLRGNEVQYLDQHGGSFWSLNHGSTRGTPDFLEIPDDCPKDDRNFPVDSNGERLTSQKVFAVIGDGVPKKIWTLVHEHGAMTYNDMSAKWQDAFGEPAPSKSAFSKQVAKMQEFLILRTSKKGRSIVYDNNISYHAMKAHLFVSHSTATGMNSIMRPFLQEGSIHRNDLVNKIHVMSDVSRAEAERSTRRIPNLIHSGFLVEGPGDTVALNAAIVPEVRKAALKSLQQL